MQGQPVADVYLVELSTLSADESTAKSENERNKFHESCIAELWQMADKVCPLHARSRSLSLLSPQPVALPHPAAAASPHPPAGIIPQSKRRDEARLLMRATSVQLSGYVVFNSTADEQQSLSMAMAGGYPPR